MNWETFSGIMALVGIANYLMLLSIKQSIAENNDRLREWINGSFMRSKEVVACIRSMESRIERLEERNS